MFNYVISNIRVLMIFGKNLHGEVYSIKSDVINVFGDMQREGGFIPVSSTNKYGRHEKI
jgi:hypothetical protein